jgi:RNA polymerase sigma factor (TIGR02999 family)
MQGGQLVAAHPDEGLTALLQRAGRGEKEAQERAVTLIYQEIRRLAEHMMREERQLTLQPTALANEAFLRLAGTPALENPPDRAYFFASASKAMRRILVDEYRRRNAQKRGGEFARHGLSELFDRYERQSINVVDLDQALNELETLSPRQAKVVHLRWFMEFTVQQVAEALHLSISTVEADWRAARAFLRCQLEHG